MDKITVKKKILRDYGKRFRDKSEVLVYMAGVARGLYASSGEWRDLEFDKGV